MSSPLAVVAEENLRNARRLRGVAHFNGDIQRDLRSAGNFFDGRHRRAGTDLGSDGDRGGKADLVGAVVHAHGDTFNPNDLTHENGNEGQSEIPVCNRATKRSTLGPFGVYVDPLVVAGGVSEQVDLILGHGDVLAIAEVLADQILEGVQAFDGCCHDVSSVPTTVTTLGLHRYHGAVTLSPHPERHRQINDGWARAAIFGASDGLVTNVSLILGFAGAQPGHSVVRLAGLAGLVAGAFSMASGEYLSMTAQRELFEREIDVERRAIAQYPSAERDELEAIFVSRSIEPTLAAQLADGLMRDPELALRTHTREELGIDPNAVGNPVRAAMFSLVAFALGALIPLLPWLVTTSGNQVWWSVGVSAVASFALGGTIGWFSDRGVWRAGFRQLAITALAATVTWCVGRAVGTK